MNPTDGENEQLLELIKIASVWKILSGMSNNTPALVIGPDGKINPVPGGPDYASYLVWKSLASKKRDILVGLAISEIASLIDNTEVRQEIQAIAASLVSMEAQQLTEKQLSSLTFRTATLKLISLRCIKNTRGGEVELHFQGKKVWGPRRLNANDEVDLKEVGSIEFRISSPIDLHENGLHATSTPSFVNPLLKAQETQPLSFPNGNYTLTYEVT